MHRQRRGFEAIGPGLVAARRNLPTVENSVSEPIEQQAYEDCAGCGHSRAYHDGQRGRPCRAWAPDDSPDQTTDNYCKCPKWQEPSK